MAKKLKNFEFKRTGRISKYPWEEWSDGSTWELEQGVDFQNRATSVRTLAASYAKRKGLKVRTSIQGENLVLQFYDPSDNGAQSTAAPETSSTESEKPKPKKPAARKSSAKKRAPKPEESAAAEKESNDG